MSLRDAIIRVLSSVPGKRTFNVHVLVTSPQKHAGLFPYAHPRPKALLQDILVLVSEQATPESPTHFVTAVEASVYQVPSTSCAVLYIGKVDTTGHGAFPSPTATVVQSLLSYYVNPSTRPIPADTLWIHLFARSQSQYMFPNSADSKGKRVLSDAKLCAWWKRVLGQVTAAEGTEMKLYHVLPGMSEADATRLIGTSDQTQWLYGHPYSQKDIPLPCPPSKAEHNLGQYIPSFDDDPKARFLDELSGESEGPTRKRRKTGGPESVSVLSTGELGQTTADEFWERMSFRQECVSGAITGFFALGVTAVPSSSTGAIPVEWSPGNVSSQFLKRITTLLCTAVEFATPELSEQGTKFIVNEIRGMCAEVTAEQADSDEKEHKSLSDASRTDPPGTPSVDFYHSYIYDKIAVDNAVLTKTEEPSMVKPVTMLTVRKKKRPAP